MQGHHHVYGARHRIQRTVSKKNRLLILIVCLSKNTQADGDEPTQNRMELSDQTFYTATQFKKWYVGERLEGARVNSEPVDDLLELAELTANFMVLNAKFDRRVDEDWGVVKVILADPLLAEKPKLDTYIEHFWSRLTESLEIEGNSRPRLMKTVAGLDTNSSRSCRPCLEHGFLSNLYWVSC